MQNLFLPQTELVFYHRRKSSSLVRNGLHKCRTQASQHVDSCTCTRQLSAKSNPIPSTVWSDHQASSLFRWITCYWRSLIRVPSPFPLFFSDIKRPLITGFYFFIPFPKSLHQSLDRFGLKLPINKIMIINPRNIKIPYKISVGCII